MHHCRSMFWIRVVTDAFLLLGLPIPLMWITTTGEYKDL
jgi:hypothetical protein